MSEVNIKNVTKIYGKNVEAVKNLSLKIHDKEFFSLLGPSGCGKSTTLRMIAGLEEVTSGEIYIGDKKVTNLSPAKRDIALAFENYALYTYLNVYQNIAFPLQIRKLPKEDIDKKVKKIAEFLKITHLLNVPAKSLSGGQQQIVGVARALVRKPNVFLLDEPISHLEDKLKGFMRTELKRIQHETQITTIYVTHDQEEAISMSDRICIMNLGEIQQLGPPKEIYNNPTNIFVATFVGEPPMNILEAIVVNENNQLKLQVFGKKTDFPRHYVAAIGKANYGQLGSKKVKIGIRPQDVKCFKSNQDENLIEGLVLFAEPRDEGKAVLTIKIEDVHVIVKTDSKNNPGINKNIFLCLEEKGIYVFDYNTEVNLNRIMGDY